MTAPEREVRQCGRTLPHLKHLTLQGRVAYQCPGIELAPLSGEALSEHVRAELDRGVAIFAASEVASLLAEVDRLRDFKRRVTEEVEEFEDAANDDPTTPPVALHMIKLLRMAMAEATEAGEPA